MFSVEMNKDVTTCKLFLTFLLLFRFFFFSMRCPTLFLKTFVRQYLFKCEGGKRRTWQLIAPDRKTGKIRKQITGNTSQAEGIMVYKYLCLPPPPSPPLSLVY